MENYGCDRSSISFAKEIGPEHDKRQTKASSNNKDDGHSNINVSRDDVKKNEISD